MLDFLSIKPGARLHDPRLLPVEAARRILGVIRDAAGPDTHLQTAVASTPGFVGLIDAARVGRDFGEGRPMAPYHAWRNATYCLHDEHFANTHLFVQNAAANWFTHGKVYLNDLNALTIDKPVPLEHARIAVTLFGLAGGSPVTLGDDLRRIVVKFISAMGGINMTRAGGAYFFFPEHIGQLDSLMEVVGLQGESYAYAVQLNVNQRNQDSVGIAAQAKVTAEVDRLRAEVEDWAGGSNFRNSTLESRIERYKELKSELGMLSGMLTLHATDLDAELDKLTEACTALLTGDQATLPSPAHGEAASEEQVAQGTSTSAGPPDANDVADQLAQQADDDDDGIPADPTPPSRPSVPGNGESKDPGAAAFARMTVAKLRKLARSKGINPRGMSKDELVDAIEATL